MTKNMTLRYIPSAFQSAGSFLTVHKYYPKLAEDMLLGLANQHKDIDIGVLYNAFSEKSDAPEFNAICRPLGIKQYADSGGLQVMSIGAEITPEIKKEIFHTQMDNCDYAMSFDEIPVGSTQEGEGLRQMDTRFFIDEWFKTKAIESGKNIVEQIKVFKKDPTSKAKILFIIQSRNFKTAREWSWFMFQEIKKEPDYEKYIGGLALGNTGAGGLRNVIDFTLRFQNELDFLPLSWRKKVHILGAGSVSRLLGALCVSDEYFLPGTTITCDSTTQTRGPVFGNFLLYHPETESMESISPSRGINPESLKMCEAQWKYAKPYFDKHKNEYSLIPTDVDDFRNHYTEYADNGLRKKVDFVDLMGKSDECDYEYSKRSRMSRFFWAMTMMHSFLDFIESIKDRSDKYRAGNHAEQVKILRSLKRSLPQKLYKPAEKLMALRSHNQYIQSENLAGSGHPYTTILPIESQNDVIDGILEYKGTKYQTDLYQGQLLGRELESLTAGKDEMFPKDTRSKILVLLQGLVLDVQKTEKITKVELDEW